MPLRQLLQRQAHGAAATVDDGGDPHALEPLSNEFDRDVRLVLRVARLYFDRPTENMTAEFVGGHARRNHRTWTANCGIDARHVVRDPDPHRRLRQAVEGEQHRD